MILLNVLGHIGFNAGYLNCSKVLESYIQEQLNVRKVTFTTDKKAYGVELRAEPQIPILGKRLGKEAKNVFKECVDTLLKLENVIDINLKNIIK